MFFRNCVLVTVSLLPIAYVQAQSRTVDLDTTAQGQALIEEDARSDANRASEWRIAVGGGVAVAPTYPGSDSYRGHVVPIAQFTYKKFYAGVSGIGFDFVRDRHWQLRASLAPSRGRDEADDASLAGLGNVDSTIRAGVFASYRANHFNTRVHVTSDIAGKKQGTLVRADVSYQSLVAERVILSVGPGVTWASNQYTQSFFGVTADQSTRSGLPVYAADGGINSVRVSVSALYLVNRHWLGSASYTISQLRGAAASSPITHSATQNLFFVGALYRF